MELSKAKEFLQEILVSETKRFSIFDIKIKADVYCADSKTFTNRPDDDPYADVLCASLTVYSKESEEDSDACGFDIILSLSKNKSVKDEELKSESEQFKEKLDDFFTRISATENIGEFIKSEAEKEKEYYNLQMDEYNKRIKKARRTASILFSLILCATFFTIFVLFIR